MKNIIQKLMGSQVLVQTKRDAQIRVSVSGVLEFDNASQCYLVWGNDRKTTGIMFQESNIDFVSGNGIVLNNP